MDNKSIIFDKLEAFIKKFYYNELIKGIILFISLGVLYFIFTSLIEYFLWLTIFWRSLLFWLFIFVELFLLLRFILFPIFKLFKIKSGISYNEASIIIGNHFNEINDTLLNFIQLSSVSNSSSELLIASIDQKAANLKPISFNKAINFKKNIKYLPYLMITFLIVLFFLFSGKFNILSNSFKRVVAYNQSFLPPAPFQFIVTNPSLNCLEGEKFDLFVSTEGAIIPENVLILINNEEFFLEQISPGKFKYTFTSIDNNINFKLFSNDVFSKEFVLNVSRVPSISNLEMKLIYPSYLKKNSEIISGTGNATIPEGTSVSWNIEAINTSSIDLLNDKKTYPFVKGKNSFFLEKKIKEHYIYTISTSNINIKKFESLNFSLLVIKDQFPKISVLKAPDSLNLNKDFYIGNVSDDYGLYKLFVKYYPSTNPTLLKEKEIPIGKGSVDNFLFNFQSLDLQEGSNYEFYFEIFDNDFPNGYKSSKSNIFSIYNETLIEKESDLLKEQLNSIDNLSKSLETNNKQQNDFNKLSKIDKEKKNLDYLDKKKIENFISRQKEHEELMKDFSKKIKENLEQFSTDPNDFKKENLKNKLEDFNKQSEENKRLLEELQKITDKLDKEKIFEKIDNLKKSSKVNSKSLEQLLELTKRYYVEQKIENISNKLEDLSKKQEKLSNDKENNSLKQDKINNEFESIEKEIDDVIEENKNLKTPMDLPIEESDSKDIKNDLKDSKNELDQNNKKQASKKQKQASKKMEEMSKKMNMSMSMGMQMQLEEDTKLIRQILDNLLAFSFDEEDLMDAGKNMNKQSVSTSILLKRQQDLISQFKHVDDSIFAVSLRNPMISNVVLKEVEEIHYNLNKAIDNISDSKFSKGYSHQQYALTSANKLADLLSDTRESMQMQMQGSGAGKPQKGNGSGKQLPDIIKGQDELGDKIKDAMKEGSKKGDKQGKDNPGDKKGSSNPSGNGENGDEGFSGKVLDILKEQQQLREALEKALEKEGNNGIGQNAVEQMKDLEKQLINMNFSNQTLNKVLQLKHELLKLDKALQQQGEDKKRKSDSNTTIFNGNNSVLDKKVLEYLNSIEILNRQRLPLQPYFNNKVQNYFKDND